MSILLASNFRSFMTSFLVATLCLWIAQLDEASAGSTSTAPITTTPSNTTSSPTGVGWTNLYLIPIIIGLGMLLMATLICICCRPRVAPRVSALPLPPAQPYYPQPFPPPRSYAWSYSGPGTSAYAGPYGGAYAGPNASYRWSSY